MGVGGARTSGAHRCAKTSVTVIRPPQREQQGNGGAAVSAAFAACGFSRGAMASS
jgi:hypothetical protein